MSMFGGGYGGGDGDMTTTVHIGGEASGGAAAVGQMVSALGQLGPAAQQASEQAGRAFTGMNGLSDSVQRASVSVGRALGDGPEGVGGFFAQLGGRLGEMGGRFQQFAGSILGAINPLNLLHSHILRLVEVMSLWRFFDTGIQKLQEFASGIFELPIMMEKAQGSWQYMFNPERTAGQSMAQWMAQGKGISQGISNWTVGESINLPYTRQDLIAAITALAPAGLSAKGIEQYLPVIADVAAAQNPNLSLQQAGYSVMGAMMGYSRMLRYDLHINPEQLYQFGYQEGNSSTLLPALQKYAENRGITSYNAKGQDVGAAYNISHSTFWGEWSSFIDRIQNSQLATGDYGPFQSLKKGLEWVNNFMDTHHKELDDLAHLLGDSLSTAMNTFGNAALAFGKGLSESGVGNLITTGLDNFTKWLSDPKVQKNIGDIATALGGGVGTAIKHIADDFNSLGGKWNDFTNSFTPQEAKDIADTATSIGSLVDTLTQFAGSTVVSSLHDMNQSLKDILATGDELKKGNWGAALGDYWKSITDQFSGTVGHFRKGHDPTQAIDDWLSGVGSAIGNFFSGLWTSITTWLQQFGTTLWTGGTQAIQQFAAGISSQAASLSSMLTSSISSVFSTWASGLLQAFQGWGAGLITALVSGIQSALPNLSGVLQGVNSIIGGVVGGGLGLAAPVGGGGGSSAYSSTTAYNTQYGAATTNITLHGVPTSAVQQVVAAAQQRSNDAGNRMVRRPGNYGRLGWIG